MWLLNFVGTKVGRLVASVLAVLGSILLVFKMGQRDQSQKQKIKDLEGLKEALEKVNEVDTNLDRSARIERMRDNGAVRKD
jgi:hypothetical protein